MAKKVVKSKPQRRAGGRTWGTENKDKLYVASLCARLGCDPFEVLAYIALMDWQSLGYESEFTTKFGAGAVPIQVPVIELDHRLAAAKELAKYIQPQLKAVEHSGPKGEALEDKVVIVLPSNGREANLLTNKEDQA